jgi:hypothetical protein
MRSGTGVGSQTRYIAFGVPILPVGYCGIGILPMIHVNHKS